MFVSSHYATIHVSALTGRHQVYKLRCVVTKQQVPLIRYLIHFIFVIIFEFRLDRSNGCFPKILHTFLVYSKQVVIVIIHALLTAVPTFDWSD
jgi:hypothetical protein